METRKPCFVIMPFSQSSEAHTEAYWNAHFETFLKPVIDGTGNLEANRSAALRGDILRQIVTSLVTSDVVVADLTDHNPNVFWELGVRQSFKHSTVTIAEVGTKLPFDISCKGTLFYHPHDHLKNEAFRSQFGTALNDCIHNPTSADSHVLETLSGRGTLFEIFRRDEASRRMDSLLSELSVDLVILDRIEVRAKDNQSKGDGKRTYLTQRMRLSSLTLLATDRYVEAPNSFYSITEKCLSDMGSLNDQLNLWENSPNSTEKWALQGIPDWKKSLERLQEESKMIREKLSRQL